MSMKATIQGVIGHGNLRPICTKQMKNRQGKGTVETKFMRFSMFCEDFTRGAVVNPKTGRTERPKEIIQVILPETDRGENIFKILEPGRMVQVTGRLRFEPAMSVGKEDGKQHVYANARIYMDELTFLDSPLSAQMNRCASVLVAAAAISEEQSKEFVTKVNQYLAGLAEKNGPPRVYEDKTGTVHDDNYDPDLPSFAQ